MAFSMEQSIVVKILGVSIIMLLVACSEHSDKSQVHEHEKKEYITSPSLRALTNPVGIILPLRNNDYEIPYILHGKTVSKNLDIRPPTQSMALLHGLSSQFFGKNVVIPLENRVQSGNLWYQVTAVIHSRGYPIAFQQDAQQTLTTDWVVCSRKDENKQYSGRYQITLTTKDYQTLLQVTSLGIRREDQPVVTKSTVVQRYTVAMFNAITIGLQQFNDDHATRSIQRENADMIVQSSSDESGLPLLIVYSPYNTVWIHLPSALSCIGMKIKDSCHQLGMISLTYQKQSNVSWDHFGAKNPKLRRGDYKLQVGDLNNRSSLQFIDSKGHILTQLQNDALVAVFQAALSHKSTS